MRVILRATEWARSRRGAPEPLASQCGAARGQRRRVYLSHFRKPEVVAGEAGKAWRRQMYRERYEIEGKHAEQKDRHGLRRARYWGLAKVHLQAIVTATVTNLKRLAKLLAPGQRLVPQAA